MEFWKVDFGIHYYKVVVRDGLDVVVGSRVCDEFEVLFAYQNVINLVSDGISSDFSVDFQGSIRSCPG